MHTQTYPVTLAHQAISTVADAAEVSIHCRQGTLWITLDGDPRDIVLEAGESFTAHEHAKALIYALTDARLEVEAAKAPKLVPARPLPRPQMVKAGAAAFA